MPTIETKFGMGDTVWHASTTTEKRRHECPDCKGSRKWEARSPAGGVFEVACPRCSQSYMANHALSLDYSVFAPRALKMTVGQVRGLAGPTQWEDGNQYMCLETGVGSGALYREADLYATEAEALAAAKIKADLTNADPDFWVAKQFNETAKLCDYELKDATMRAAEELGRDAARKFGYLIEDLEGAERIEEVKDIIANWRDRDGEQASESEAA